MLKPTGGPGAPLYIWLSATGSRFTLLLSWKLPRVGKFRAPRWTGKCRRPPTVVELSYPVWLLAFAPPHLAKRREKGILRLLLGHCDRYRIRGNSVIAADVSCKHRRLAGCSRRLHAHRVLAIENSNNTCIGGLPSYACADVWRLSSCGCLGGQTIRPRRGRAHG